MKTRTRNRKFRLTNEDQAAICIVIVFVGLAIGAYIGMLILP